MFDDTTGGITDATVGVWARIVDQAVMQQFGPPLVTRMDNPQFPVLYELKLDYETRALSTLAAGGA